MTGNENHDKTLTAKQEKFAREFVRLGCQSAAYRSAYDCENCGRGTIRNEAYILRWNPLVSERIDELQKEAARRNEITIDRIAQEYAKIAFTHLPGIADYNGGQMTLEDFDNLTSEQRACIKEFKVKTETKIIDDEPVECSHVEIKLHDKLNALEKLGKWQGMFVDKTELSLKTPPTLNIIMPSD